MMKRSSWLLSKRKEAAALRNGRERTNAAADGDDDGDEGDGEAQAGEGGEGRKEDTAFSSLVSSAAAQQQSSLSVAASVRLSQAVGFRRRPLHGELHSRGILYSSRE